MSKDYLQKAAPIIKEVKVLAQQYRAVLGRPLGITAEVAEYEAIRLLGLEVCQVRQEGCDAIRILNQGPIREEKIQIKGRVVLKKSAAQRISGIKRDKDWDALVLVLLDEHFKPTGVYEAKRSVVLQELDRPGSATRKRGQLSVGKFKKIAAQIWPV